MNEFINSDEIRVVLVEKKHLCSVQIIKQCIGDEIKSSKIKKNEYTPKT